MAVDVTQESLAALNLVLDVDKEILGVPLRIRGGNDASHNLISGTNDWLIFYKAGPTTVSMRVSPPWASRDTPWGVAGNIVWKLHVISTGQRLGMNSSRVEFYAINKDLPPFYKGTVPVKLARRFVLPRQTKTSWIRHCCKAVFHDFLFEYETQCGGSGYGVHYGGGQFQLERYLRHIGRGELVNCFDQAGIMQICLALCPATASTDWIGMSPFGYIKTTVLVGHGACNNPMFGNNGSSKVCDNNLPGRSGFGNHAFLRTKERMIVDACCGPFHGDKTLDKYINESIQDKNETRLYETPGEKYNLPGKPRHASPKGGINGFKI